MANEAKVRRLSEIRSNRKKYEPYVIELDDDGTRATLADPRELTLKEMSELDTLPMEESLKKLLGADLGEYVLESETLTLGDWLDIMEDWRDHFDLGGPGKSRSSSG